MASKATTDRQKSAVKVIAACNTHGGSIESSVGKLYGEDAGSAAKILVIRIAEALSARVDAMIKADNAHEAELGDDGGIREHRDELAHALYDKIVNVRTQLTVIIGGDYVKRIGISGSTPQDAVALSRLGETVGQNLLTVEPPKIKVPGFKFDAGEWAGPISELAKNLKEILTKAATEEREAEATLINKRDAIKLYDEEFSNAANLTSTLLEVAGQKELAARVRPSTHRPGQTIEDAADATGINELLEQQAG